MQSVEEMIDSVVKGQHPATVVRKAVMSEEVGPGRTDVTPEQQATMFDQLIQQSASSVPYQDMQYTDGVLSQIRQGADMAELVALAQKNRDQYAEANLGSADFQEWDVILHSLLALQTDQLPPTNVA